MLFSSLVVSVLIGILVSPPRMAENKAVEHVVQGNNRFTGSLYRALSEREGNVFFSPISVHAVLAMVFQGAQGTTAERFTDALAVTDAATAAQGYNGVLNSLNAVPNVTLLMANRVYLMAGHQLLEPFNVAVTKQFLSEVQQLDFAQNDVAAATINDWVKEQTREKIQDLIQANDLNAFTRLVLVNAIYFKGDWLHKFDKERTKIEPFFLNNEDKVDVHMMHLKKRFYYKDDEELGAQVLQLPYTNEDLSMVIILPKKKDGILELEKKLATVDLVNITQEMYRVEVNVALPRFKIEQTIDLKDSLTKLGLGEIFDQDKANFRGMIPLKSNENLYVSKAVQKAFIEVNEEGAEAAAATGLHVVKKRSLNIPEEFIANHPFIFLITVSQSKPNSDRIDDNVIFHGRISEISSELPIIRDEF